MYKVNIYILKLLLYGKRKVQIFCRIASALGGADWAGGCGCKWKIMKSKYPVKSKFSAVVESDLKRGLATFVAYLVLPLQLGILVGTGINILFTLYHAARSKLRVDSL
uniref:Uncharacterized protein n=1 Tax=Glossina brevipalpis TaxID=37001 RepID=A0A1A9W8R2_9MUSC